MDPKIPASETIKAERPRLICPRCRRLVEGRLLTHEIDPLTLRCDGCGTLYPHLSIPDGEPLPVLLPNPADHTELLAESEALLRALHRGEPLDEVAPQTAQGQRALNGLLSYAPAHMGAHALPPVPSPDMSWAAQWLEVLDDLPPGPVLVLGAAACGELLHLKLDGRHVVALEANPAPIGWAASIAAGSTSLPMRRTASEIITRPLALPALPLSRLQRATLLCADALNPPFEAESFAAIVCLNLVDSVPEPDLLLGQCQALLRPAGALVLASPWAWRDDITPPDQRLDRSFDPKLPQADQMAALLTGARQPGFLAELRLQHLCDDIPWPLRVNDRFTALYRLQAFLLRKRDETDENT